MTHLSADTEVSYVVKKCNQYSTIVTPLFTLLDISNFLAANSSYAKFLVTFGVRENKSYSCYEWFDSYEKLDFPVLPPYEAFYSKLKGCNVLEEELLDWEKGNRTGTKPSSGAEKYNNLLKIWKEKNMTVFADFL